MYTTKKFSILTSPLASFLQRFNPGELSYSDYLEFAKRSEPFVVNYRGREGRGKTGIPGIPNWTLENIRRTCFNRTFPLKAQDDR
jgi:hypothetical protein